MICLLLTSFTSYPLSCQTLKPGVYHVVNLGHPYAPASFDNKNRVVLPQDFSGNYDLVLTFCFSPVTIMLTFFTKWEVVTHPERADRITIQNLRGKNYAQISSPAQVRRVPPRSPSSLLICAPQGQFVSTGNHPTAFSTVLSGTADFPGDDVIIPDTHLDYWTVHYIPSVSTRFLILQLRSVLQADWSGPITILSGRRFVPITDDS